MSDAPDARLLDDFVRSGSESAFAELVRRHLDLVYSVALRHAANSHHAQEISQAVFLILARKASSLGSKVVLTGWLYHTARLTAANFQRAEIRRVRREQEAYMQSTLDQPPSDAAWRELSPLLDEAMAGLRTEDRDAIVLRFFENRNLHEVGAVLGVEERAAQKRVLRALEKLRGFFTRRGVALSATVLAGLVSAHSVQAAPAGLAKSISAIALAKGAAASGSTLTLVKGVLKIMAWTKIKIALVVGVGFLVAAGTTTAVVESVNQPKPVSEDSAPDDNPKYWKTDSRSLSKVPPLMIFRLTKFPGGGGSVSMNHRLMQKDVSVEDLLDTAYGMDQSRTILPPDMPSDRYDLLYTLPGPLSSVLPQQIAKKTGYTAHKEQQMMDVLVLQVANPNPPNLHPAQDQMGSSMSSDGKQMTIRNQDMSALKFYIQSLVDKPVIDRTDLSGKYDITFNPEWQWGHPSRAAVDHALLEQLGLKLVPSHESVEVLIVEKTPQK